MSVVERDRYVSFIGLDCDTNAVALVERIQQLISRSSTDQRWCDYFTGKLEEKARMGVDDLFFVGSQLNNIYALMEACGDEEGDELLYQIEQECC